MVVEGGDIDKKQMMKRLGLKKITIVSFDIRQNDKAKRASVSRLLYGRTETRTVNGETRTYEYAGLLDEGGFRLGQSVFLLHREQASRFITRLEEMKVDHRFWTFWTDS